MQKKLERKLSVSYTYDPGEGTLEVICDYNGLKDGFCATFDESPPCETIHEFINGFVQFLREKDSVRKTTKEERKMAEVIRKNLPYSLEVWERNERSLVGSDMDPVKLASWDTATMTHSFWLVHQEGRPVLVEQAIGDSAEEDFWKAYELPKLTEVLLNKDIEEK